MNEEYFINKLINFSTLFSSIHEQESKEKY